MINGNNITTEEKNMSLLPFLPNEKNQIFITFDQEEIITAINIWNYNKNEFSHRGV